MPVLEVEQLEFLRVASSTETEAREKVLKPLNIAPAKDNALDIAFASTAMLDVKGALEFLTQYPFNCLEQRLSRLSAFTGGEDFIVAFNLGDTKVLREEARKIIADVGLYQTPSGAFAYWPFASYGDPFVTAYALDILNTAAKAGFEIDANITAAAAKWLNSWLSGQGGTTAYKYSLREDETTRAYAVYALSLVPNFNAASYFNNMYAALNANSSLQARIYLLKAATNLKLARQQEVLAESITSRAKYTNTTAYFSEPGGNRWVFASDIYLTSTALEALLNSGAAFESADKTAAWLSGSLNRQGHWGNTKNNAAALSAMSAYYKAREAQTPDFKAVFSIDANKIFEAIFKGRSAAVKNYTVPFEILFKDRNDAMLEMEKQGDGRLYYNIALKYFPADFKKPVNAGFSVEKEIAPLYPALGAFAAGHRAVVNIKIVATEDRTFAVLEDFLPAGFDIVDSTLATEGSFDEEQLATQQGGSQPFNSRMERYDDRLVAFADFLPKGVHTFSYIISATNGGSYSVPSARVSLMYEPEVFGRTASGQITVK